MAVEKRLMVKIVKVLNYISALLMLVAAILRCIAFKTSTDDPFFFLLTFYLFGFAVLLVIAEIKVKRVIVYVEILNSRIGKGMYVLFVGLLLFDEQR
jgi:FtsH-binding integral membrane protein